jgi:hypothetical protein
MSNEEAKGDSCLSTLGIYAAWAISAAGIIIDMLAARQAILALLAVFSVISAEAYHRRGGLGVDITTQFGITAFDNVMLLLLGIAAIAFVIWVEYYFRKGRSQGKMYKRIAKVALIEIAVVVGAVIIIEICGLYLSRTL